MALRKLWNRGSNVALALLPIALGLGACAGVPAASSSSAPPKPGDSAVMKLDSVVTVSDSKSATAGTPVAAAAMPGKTIANALPQPEAEKTAPAAVAKSEPVVDADAPIKVVGQVIRGEPLAARSVAYVDVERCFDVIPSYRRVKAERGAKEYARYLLLVAEANDEFRAAIDWVVLRRGLDVVVTKTGVCDKRAVDITDFVCERLQSQQSGGLTR